ncbi:nuclear condensing complex subunit [Ephemerocybe angulata]|uniref:Nuclear condensing complex subunit n=1 Tax=Ephemerocybe angulata TaxID=980116 RepID=A0A8H6IEV0_9AGAR|nr:nuclear condensing complex subunit [Tulosesus angulatus]
MVKAKAPEEAIDLETLHEAIATIFDQVQTSLANHKKNCVALYKLHLRAAAVSTQIQKKNGTVSTKYTGERAFAESFLDMLNRILGMKKGPPAADRIVKFVGSYVQYSNEKVMQEQEKAGSSEEEDTETTTSRFVARIIGWLLQGFQAKNKNARFRCLHIVSELISHVGDLEDDTYGLLREGLIERLNDKETLIRAHAAAALSKLVGSEDPDELEEGEQSVLDILLEVLASDPAAEVRRASLLNVPLTPATLDTILKRTRDVDTTTRKIMYTAVLPKLGHPRHLSLVQREQVIKDGLGDREPGVRVAAGKLLTKWFDVILAEQDERTQDGSLAGWEGDDSGIMKGLIRFLALFDVIGSGEAIAVDTLISIFVTRPDIPEAFVFPEQYWQHLTPESAVLARVFVEYCIKNGNEARLEAAALPVVTAFAFIFQEAYNHLLNVLQKIEAAKLVAAGLDEYEDEDALEEELAKKEVILGELLRMALKLDYMDEIGRRKVFTVVKEMLAHPQLPPSLIERCVDVLKEIMPSERDLIRVVVEIIVELRENEELEDVDNILGDLDDQDPDQSSATEPISRGGRSARKPRDRDAMSSEERREADITDIRCLMLCTAVLERVNGSFEDNSTLEGILADLIVPSVKRKELAMREKALVSLGLCCLIAKNMALRSFQLFMGQIENAPAELKVQVLKVTLDLLIMYDQEFFKKSEAIATQITNFLVQTLQNEEIPAAQAVLCTGICKLVLAGIINDPNVLVTLALLYISPGTSDNQELRQCLSYFFPVYSYASAANQCRVQSMYLLAYDQAKEMHDDLEDGQQMISPYDFGLMLVDWTDPAKAVQIAQIEHSPDEPVAHAELAIQILSALYDEDRSDSDKKAFCQTLNQLHIPAELDSKSIHKLDLLVSHLSDQSPLNNTANEKLFARFKSRVASQFAKQLKELDPAAYGEEEDVLKVYECIAVEPPKGGVKAVRPRPSSPAKPGGEEGGEVEGEGEGEGEQEPASRGTERTSTRSRASTSGETASAVTATTQAAEEEEGDKEEDEEEKEEEPTPQPEERPSTPQKKKGTKRVHTPGTGRGEERKRTRRGTATR